MRSAIYHLSSRAYTFSQVPLSLAETEKLKCMDLESETLHLQPTSVCYFSIYLTS